MHTLTPSYFLVALKGGEVFATRADSELQINRLLTQARAQAARVGLKARTARIERLLTKREAGCYPGSQRLDLTRILDQHKLIQATLY